MVRAIMMGMPRIIDIASWNSVVNLMRWVKYMRDMGCEKFLRKNIGVWQWVGGNGHNQIASRYPTSQFKLVIRMFLINGLFISITWLWSWKKKQWNETS